MEAGEKQDEVSFKSKRSNEELCERSSRRGDLLHGFEGGERTCCQRGDDEELRLECSLEQRKQPRQPRQQISQWGLALDALRKRSAEACMKGCQRVGSRAKEERLWSRAHFDARDSTRSRPAAECVPGLSTLRPQTLMRG